MLPHARISKAWLTLDWSRGHSIVPHRYQIVKSITQQIGNFLVTRSIIRQLWSIDLHQNHQKQLLEKISKDWSIWRHFLSEIFFHYVFREQKISVFCFVFSSIKRFLTNNHSMVLKWFILCSETYLPFSIIPIAIFTFHSHRKKNLLFKNCTKFNPLTVFLFSIPTHVHGPPLRPHLWSNIIIIG